MGEEKTRSLPGEKPNCLFVKNLRNQYLVHTPTFCLLKPLLNVI